MRIAGPPKSKSTELVSAKIMQLGPFALQEKFHISFSSAWNTQFSAPVSRSSAIIASLVPVVGCDVFSPVVTITCPRAASIVGVVQIGAPEGPRCFTPVELTMPLYSALGIVWYSHSFSPLAKLSAVTAPWLSQHSYFGLPPAITPDPERGTIILSSTITGVPVIMAWLSMAWPLATQFASPVAALSEYTMPRWSPKTSVAAPSWLSYAMEERSRVPAS